MKIINKDAIEHIRFILRDQYKTQYSDKELEVLIKIIKKLDIEEATHNG